MTTLAPPLNLESKAPERFLSFVKGLALELAAPPIGPDEPEYQALARLLVACGRPPLSTSPFGARSARHYEREFSRALLLHAQDAHRAATATPPRKGNRWWR